VTAGGGKGRIRALVRRGVASDHGPAVHRKYPEPREGAVCEWCGLVFQRAGWRRTPKTRLTAHLRGAVAWTTCPACRQVGRGEFYGCVVARGRTAANNEAAIARRVANVAARAQFTQPERRVVEMGGGSPVRGAVWQVLTTSQKLAHRIAHELEKAFGGRTTYRWSDSDGSLLAIWDSDRTA
jgi:hypothetical protein